MEETIVKIIWNTIYKFFMLLDSLAYQIADWLYQIYIVIADARIFNSETFETFLGRVYAVLGVAMLFVLAYSLLQSIINPDSFSNGDKSTTKIVINTVTSIILIAVVPTIFNFLYYAQEIITTQNIIGKLILGSYSTASDTLTITFPEEECNAINEMPGNTNSSCTKKYKSDGSANSVKTAGSSIVTDVFAAFYYPRISNKKSSTENEQTSNTQTKMYTKKFLKSDLNKWGVNFKKGDNEETFYRVLAYSICSDSEGIYSGNENITNNNAYVYGGAAYKCADDVEVANDKNDLRKGDSAEITYKGILNYAKSEGKFDSFKLISPAVYEGEMVYTFIISTIAGGFICYIFLSYCLDMGLRAAKLGFAQLVAPIPILSRILPSQSKMFTSWTSFTSKCYFEVFLRIAVIFLGIFMITNLPDISGLWEQSSLTVISMLSLKTPLIMDISASWGVLGFARVVIIIGILMFVKQAPQLITDALGINISTGSLKIKDKLKNMLGGEKLIGGYEKARGTITGAAGGAYSAMLNSEKGKRLEAIKAGALKGAQGGYKSGGKQFGNQRQSAYSDLTGDYKYEAGLFGGKSITGKMNASIDKTWKDLGKSKEEYQQSIVDRIEKMVEKQVEQNVNKAKNVENSYEFRKLNRQMADENYRRRQGMNSEEFRKMQEDYKKNVTDNVNNFDINKGFKTREEYKKFLTDTWVKATNEANQSNRDEFIKHLDTRDKEVREETRELYKNRDIEYKKALESNSETIRKSIVDSMDASSRKAYDRASSELEAKGKAKRKKDVEDIGKELSKLFGDKK